MAVSLTVEGIASAVKLPRDDEVRSIILTPPEWLKIARELHAIAQSGLTYCKNEFDLERYHRLQEMSAEIIIRQSTLSQEEVQESFAMQPGYITPKIDVRAAVIREGKILLVKEYSDGRWSLPGGWADVGDTPSQAIIREVREESGFDVEIKSVIGIYDANRVPSVEMMPFYHAYKLLFLCSINGGEARTSHETPDVDFFAPDNLPLLSTYRTNKVHIADAFAQAENRQSKTVFD